MTDNDAVRGLSRRLSGLLVGLLAITVASIGHARAGSVPSDPGFSAQWGLEVIGAPEVWEVADGTGTTIAIVDSGVDLRHIDLRPRLLAGVSCVGSGGDPAACAGAPRDDSGHGTHVAGIAAAATDNGQGVAGVAPGAKILPVKVLEHSCPIAGPCGASGASSDVAAGIEWAADHDADVINLSLGSAIDSITGPRFATAVEYAWSKGAIPVIAAGNGDLLATQLAEVPAIIVAATARDDAAASYSNGVGAARWAISAPGGEGGDDKDSCVSRNAVGILSTYWVDGRDDQYGCLSGTSMAAPHVAGAAAVLRSGGLSPQETVDRLLGTAVDLGPTGDDQSFGAGRLDLASAAAGLGPSGAPIPSTSTTPPPTTAPVPTTSPPTTGGGGAPPPDGGDEGNDGTDGGGPPVSIEVSDVVSADPEQATGLSVDSADDGVPAAIAGAAVALALGAGAGASWWIIRLTRVPGLPPVDAERAAPPE